MEKKIQKQGGITLVALIITIIVMLILVAVSVNVLIKSNLMGTAGKAGNSYKTAAGQEQNIENSITVNGEKLDEYIETMNKIQFSITDENGKKHTFFAKKDQTWISWIKENEEEFFNISPAVKILIGKYWNSGNPTFNDMSGGSLTTEGAEAGLYDSNNNITKWKDVIKNDEYIIAGQGL